MKYYTKVDMVYRILVGFVVLVIMGASYMVVITSETLSIVPVIILSLMIFLFSYLFFNMGSAYYEIREDHIFINFVVFKTKIYFKDIESVEVKKSNVFYNNKLGFSNDTIYIRMTKLMIRGYFISPKEQDEFLHDLNRQMGNGIYHEEEN